MVRIRTSENLMVIEGSGQFEETLRLLIAKNKGLFSTATGKKPGSQVFISQEDLKSESIDLKIYIWKDTRIIFE